MDNKAKEYDVRSVIGCEVYAARSDHKEKSNTRYNHHVPARQNQEGYRNLIKLVSTASSKVSTPTPLSARAISSSNSQDHPACWIPMGKDARGSSVVVIHSETHYFRDPGIRGAGKKPEYDFSKGVRGKLFRPDAEARLPVYLDREVQRYLVQRAADKGTSIEDMVNDLLKREIEIIEPVK